jgi:hypothetical protein
MTDPAVIKMIAIAVMSGFFGAAIVVFLVGELGVSITKRRRGKL